MKGNQLAIGRPKSRSMRKKAGLESWRNVRTKLGPSDLAESYALAHCDHPLYGEMLKVLRLFSEDPQAAKKAYEQWPITEFCDCQELYVWRQFGALFLKSWDGASDASQRKAAAFASFKRGESRCRRYNKKLKYYTERPNRMPEQVRVVWSRAREIIRQSLGEFTPGVLWDLIVSSRPGGGTAIGTRDRTAVSPAAKYGYTDLCTTRSALPYARALVETSPIRVQCIGREQGDGWVLEYRMVEGNRVTVVPKDATIDRTIAIEPALNVELQLGVHEHLSRRVLPGLGVTIDSQEPNRRAAREGALGWELADPYVTLDLRNSSNSLSTEMVRALLPNNGWLGYLDDIRSKRYELEGSVYDYEMWSSMGNGYTFALQCLLYMALAKATLSLTESELQPRVFGDDIVVPRGCAALLIEVLQFFGCEVNTSKSFLFGPFRESCGGDYYAEHEVVPIYLRGLRKLALTDLYRLRNRFRRTHDTLYTRHLEHLLRCLGPHPLVPAWFPDDSGYHVDLEVSSWEWHRWEQRYYCLGVTWRPDRARHDEAWSYAEALRGASAHDMLDEFSALVRRGVGHYALVASPA